MDSPQGNYFKEEACMKREVFDDYINRFNKRDATTFEEYIDPHAKIINGTLVIQGMQGMKDHYAKIWKGFSEARNCTSSVL
jgi:hypothetical protein